MGIHIPGGWPSLTAMSVLSNAPTSTKLENRTMGARQTPQKKRKRTPSLSDAIAKKLKERRDASLQLLGANVRRRKAEHEVSAGSLRFNPRKVKVEEAPKETAIAKAPVLQDPSALRSSPKAAHSDESSAEDVIRPPATEIETYEELRLLGDSSYGRVYLIQSNKTHQLFATKKFKDKAKSLSESGFPREVRMLRAIQHVGTHVNVVRFHEAAISCSGDVSMRLEYCNGGDLHGQVRRFREMGIRAPVQFALHAFIQLCEGLAFLHAGLRYDGEGGYQVEARFDGGYVHNDLKPENVFLRRGPRNEYGLPDLVLGDFSHTSPVSKPCKYVVGTPRWFSPEARAMYHGQPQFPGQLITYKHDIYGLGLTLYNLLWDAYWPIGCDPRRLRVPEEHRDLGFEMVLQLMLQPFPFRRPGLTEGVLNLVESARELRQEAFEMEGSLAEKMWKTV